MQKDLISLKEKTDNIIYLAYIYRQKFITDTSNLNRFQSSRLLFDKDLEPKKYLDYCDCKELNDEERFIFRVNLSLSFLSAEEKEIIWLEFFNPPEDRMKIWLKKYRRSSFYRIRARSIDHFHLQAYALIKEAANQSFD